MNSISTAISLGLAGIIIPAAFVTLCIRMALRRVHWFTYLAYFFLFGTIGGGVLHSAYPRPALLPVASFFWSRLLQQPVSSLRSFSKSVSGRRGSRHLPCSAAMLTQQLLLLCS